MHHSHGAQKVLPLPARLRAWDSCCLPVARNLLPTLLCLVFALPACSQDSGSEDKAFFGRGTEITVTVHDGSGDPISTPAIVKLYRGGTVLSRQGETTRGSAVLVLNNLGDYTVIVQAAGYENAQKDLSVAEPGRVQLDIYLRRSPNAGTIAGVPGRPVLAPKAQDALEKGLQALKANQWKEAEKHLNEAMRLAPGHPDVLYLQGVLRLNQRNWAQAQIALEKATQIDPNYAKAFAALGMALCDQGKYGDAILPLEKSLQLDAASTSETRWALAKAYYQGARYADALKTSQQALAASNGKSPEIALLVAQSLTAVGRYEDAAQVLRDFLRDHGDWPEAATARKWLQGLAANGKIRANQN